MQGLLYAYQEEGRLAHSLSGRFPTSAVPESTVWLNTMTNIDLHGVHGDPQQTECAH